MKSERIVLLVLVIVLLGLTILNTIGIGHNSRRIDVIRETQTWLIEHPDSYWPVINVIIETQEFILELLDELIEPEKKNYTS